MSDTYEALDPEAATIIEEFQSVGLPPWHSLDVESARTLEDELFSAGSGPDMASVRDMAIEHDGRSVEIRVFRPTESQHGTLVFFHGGGWTLGTLDSADDICRNLAARGRCLVISVDYRLSPEHPFPAALDDAITVVNWASAYADTVGGDRSRLGVAGTSAGGNLAAATAIYARELSLDVQGQFLLYPITDCRFDTESYQQFADAPLLSLADMRWFWENYLRSPVDAYHPFTSVLRAPDLTGVAPAVVLTAGIDVLRDEGIAYAERLSTSGVEVDHHHYPSLPHGFLSLADRVNRADEAMDHLGVSIQTRLRD